MLVEVRVYTFPGLGGLAEGTCNMTTSVVSSPDKDKTRAMPTNRFELTSAISYFYIFTSIPDSSTRGHLSLNLSIYQVVKQVQMLLLVNAHKFL